MIDYREEIIKFIIGMLFLFIVHYQMVIQQKDKILSVSTNTEKIKESLEALKQQSSNIEPQGDDVFKNQQKILNLATVLEFDSIIDDFLKIYLSNYQRYFNFSYYIKSKKSGIFEINFHSNFKNSYLLISKIISYKKLIKINYLKITKNTTKIELQVIYEKNSQEASHET